MGLPAEVAHHLDPFGFVGNGSEGLVGHFRRDANGDDKYGVVSTVSTRILEVL